MVDHEVEPPQTEDESFIQTATTILEKLEQHGESGSHTRPSTGLSRETRRPSKVQKKHLRTLGYICDLCCVDTKTVVAAMMYKRRITIAVETAPSAWPVEGPHSEAGTSDAAGEEGNQGEGVDGSSKGKQSKPPRTRRMVPVVTEGLSGLDVAVEVLCLLKKHESGSNSEIASRRPSATAVDIASHAEALLHFLKKIKKRKSAPIMDSGGYYDWTNYCLSTTWSKTAARLHRMFRDPCNILFRATVERHYIGCEYRGVVQCLRDVKWTAYIPPYDCPVFAALVNRLQEQSEADLDEEKQWVELMSLFRELLCFILAELHQCFRGLSRAPVGDEYRSYLTRAIWYQRWLGVCMAQKPAVQKILNSLDEESFPDSVSRRYDATDFLKTMEDWYGRPATDRQKPPGEPLPAHEHSDEDNEGKEVEEGEVPGHATEPGKSVEHSSCNEDDDAAEEREDVSRWGGDYDTHTPLARRILDGLMIITKSETAARMLPLLATWIPDIGVIDSSTAPDASTHSVDDVFEAVMLEKPGRCFIPEAKKAAVKGWVQHAFEGPCHAEALLVHEFSQKKHSQNTATVYIAASERCCRLCNWVHEALVKRYKHLKVVTPGSYDGLSACTLPRGFDPAITKEVKQKLVAEIFSRAAEERLNGQSVWAKYFGWEDEVPVASI